MEYNNVIVFGDSLSDIGTKWRQFMGKFAKKINAMTVNPNGRFSDCRNWTDYMYEAGTGGQTLVVGSAKQTISASTPHKRFGPNSGWSAKGKAFRYANYAEGGACAGNPTSMQGKLGLGTFKDQVKRFRTDLPTVNVRGETFLIFVWFGANDLYTDGQKANDMPGAAAKIMKRRAEVVQILNNAGVQSTGGAVRFVFMGMGLPMSAARYQNKLDRATARVRTRDIPVKSHIKNFWKPKEQIVKDLFNARIEALNMLAAGAMLFNDRLEDLTTSPDIFVKMQQYLSEDAVTSMMEHYNMLQGTQPKGWSNMHLSAKDYDEIMEGVHVPLSTSDEAHPSDRVYKYMWEGAIAPALRQANVTFGHFA